MLQPVKRPLLMLHPSDQAGCGYYRIIQRGDIINRHAAEFRYSAAQGMSYLADADLANHAVQAVMYQRQFEAHQVEHLRRYKRAGERLICDTDDLLWNVPPLNPFSKLMRGSMKRHLVASMQLADVNLASTEPLAEEIQKLGIGNVRVLENMLDDDWFAAVGPARRAPGEPLRVLWAGSPTHEGDLRLIVDAIRSAPAGIELHLFGHRPVGLEGAANVKFRPLTPFAAYRRTMQAICQQMHVALAPLEPHRFNECKSNLKLLEYGAGWLPVIASDIAPYRDCPVRIRAGASAAEWLEALAAYDQDERLRTQAAVQSRAYAEKFRAARPENVRKIAVALG